MRRVYEVDLFYFIDRMRAPGDDGNLLQRIESNRSGVWSCSIKPTAARRGSGDWQGSWRSTDGNQHPVTMQIKQIGTKLSGTFTGQRGSTSLNGSINGNQVSFTIKARQETTFFNGTLDGNKMSGTVGRGGPTVPWTATRQQ
jgi:hypothetical protein